jgi:ABC-type nitrate/sulfonate/bicarbonate transport system substrate-binding protein
MYVFSLFVAAVAAFALPQDSTTSVDESADSISTSTSTKLQNVNYGAFTQTATYSVANQLGFFKAYGLNITYLQVPNSTYGYNQLLNGGYDIMTGTIDNAVNLRFNQQLPLTVTGQLDGGPELTIAAIPSITSITQLRGKPLMVDSPVSGYAYILRKVLALHGLYLENGDYTFQVSHNDMKPYSLTHPY